MNKENARIILAMANNNMNVCEVARQLFMNRNTVIYRLNKVKIQTGLNARQFYDLIELVKIAKEVLDYVE